MKKKENTTTTTKKSNAHTRARAHTQYKFSQMKQTIDVQSDKSSWLGCSISYLDVLDERDLFLCIFFSDLSLCERCLEAAFELMRRRLSALPRDEDDEAAVTSDSSFGSSSSESDRVIISGEAGRTTCTTATSSSSDGVPEGVTDVVPELLACNRTL